MFKWLKDRYNKYVNDRLIALYPKMHYRQRKKNAVRLAYKSKLDEIKSHIYSYHKELSKWDSFQIHSKQLLIRLKVTLTLEIKHYSKLRNLKLKLKRLLRKINVVPLVVILAKYIIRLASGISAHSAQLYHSIVMVLHSKEILPSNCSDCGLTFEKRWRDPDNPNKHLICSIIGD